MASMYEIFKIKLVDPKPGPITYLALFGFIFQGDSGGPLWINKDKRCVFYVVGITSFGPNHCGEKA